jgi:hypothetical protein
MKENLRREDINTDNLVKPKKKFPQKKIAKNEIGQRPKIFLTLDREKAEILFFETHLESERNQEEAEMGNHTRRLEGLHTFGYVDRREIWTHTKHNLVKLHPHVVLTRQGIFVFLTTRVSHASHFQAMLGGAWGLQRRIYCWVLSVAARVPHAPSLRWNCLPIPLPRTF